ncbi:MAG TPA: hypothetical protein PLY93_04010 [Turneriella sp.]|nr:hypothetical protein [Turneriella sp.]
MKFLKTTIQPLHKKMLIAIAALMGIVYFIPIWHISLVAPQYPEGLSMNIFVHSIKGGNAHDLTNINLLNHYVGMHEIIEESIPELGFMPYVLAFMILGAVVTFFHARIYMLILGVLNLFLVASAGLFDFWRWEYNYGHNLNPNAPIIVPGMTYQPPLLGCKTLLNIEACSWPHIGAILLFISVAILLVILYREKKLNSGA